jgi:TRAP-type C4-dicarboxylate transport system permease small subunit
LTPSATPSDGNGPDLGPAHGLLAAVRRHVLTADRVVGRVVLALACLALAGAALSGLYQVGSRFIFQQPSTWSEVTTRTLIIWSVFLGLSAALRNGTLLSVDLVYRTVARTRHLVWLQAMITLLTLLFLSIVVVAGWTIVQRVRFQTLAGLEISISWAYAAIPVGAVFGILAVIANFLDPRRGELDSQR